MSRSAFLFILLALSLGTGCKRDDIQTYKIPKETPTTDTGPMMGAPGTMAEGQPKDIDWTAPAGWKEQAPSSMRLGSFLIKGENGQEADMSVVPLSGEAGGDLANINRWRGQINLPPLTIADLSAQSEIMRPAGRRMLYVDFVSHDLMINNRFKKRLIAAIYHEEGAVGRTWFFKLMGEDTTVLAAKGSFMKFLRSLKFHAAS